jgi:hypothetical protein
MSIVSCRVRVVFLSVVRHAAHCVWPIWTFIRPGGVIRKTEMPLLRSSSRLHGHLTTHAVEIHMCGSSKYFGSSLICFRQPWVEV